MPSTGIRLTPGLCITPALSGAIAVQEEGVLVSERTTINFIGPGVTAADDPPNDRVNITIPAGAGATLQIAYDGGEAIVLDAQGAVDVTRGVLCPDGEPALQLIDANANPGRAHGLLYLEDANVSTWSTLRVLRTTAGEGGRFASTLAGTIGGRLTIAYEKVGVVGDQVGVLDFVGHDVAALPGNEITFARIAGVSGGVAVGNSSGRIDFWTADTSTPARIYQMRIRGGVLAPDMAGWIQNDVAAGAYPALTFAAGGAFAANQGVFEWQSNFLAAGRTVMRLYGDGNLLLNSGAGAASGAVLQFVQDKGVAVADLPGQVTASANIGPAAAAAQVSGIETEVTDATLGAGHARFNFRILGAGALDTPLRLTGVGDMTLTSVGAGVVGSTFRIDHQKAAPLVDDVVGRVQFWGHDAGLADKQFGEVSGSITIVGAGVSRGGVSITTFINSVASSTLMATPGTLYWTGGSILINVATGYLGAVTTLHLQGGTGDLSVATDLLGWNGAQHVQTYVTAGVTGPEAQLYHAKSVVGAIGDVVGSVTFYGKDANGASGDKTLYGAVTSSILSPINAAEYGELNFRVMDNGAMATALRVIGDGGGGGIFSNAKAAGATPAIRFRARSNFNTSQPIVYFENNDGSNLPLAVYGQGDVLMLSGSAGVLGPTLILCQESVSPDNNDAPGRILFRGRNNTPAAEEYAWIRGVAHDYVAANAAGRLEFWGASSDGAGTADDHWLSLYGLADTPGGFTGAVFQNFLGPATDGSQPQFTFKLVDATATLGPVLALYRDSASPANDDDIGCLQFDGRNGIVSPPKKTYGQFLMQITNYSTDPEGQFVWRTWHTGGGALADAMRLDANGQIYADLGGGAGNVTVFDDFDDAMVLRNDLFPTGGSHSQESLDRLCDMGILVRKEDGGHLIHIQGMMALVGGATYQTRTKLDELAAENAELRRRIEKLEARS